MKLDILLENLVGLSHEIGLSEERVSRILKTILELAPKSNILTYNTITTNFTVKEQKLAFYFWGILSYKYMQKK